MGSDCRCDNRIDEHTFVEKVACHMECLIVVADEQRDDRSGCVSDLASHGAEVLERVVGDVPEMLPALANYLCIKVSHIQFA